MKYVAPWTFLCALLIAVACSPQQEVVGEGGSSGARAGESIARPAPLFTAIDQDGQVFTSASLAGSPWIASFFFTSCQTVCPELNTVQADLQREFGDRIKFVSISTDPDTDDQAALRAYATTYGAQPGTWWMVRMPVDSMRSLASEGFTVMDPREPSMHSTRLVAVGPSMTIAGYFDSTDSSDIESLRSWINSQQ